MENPSVKIDMEYPQNPDFFTSITEYSNYKLKSNQKVKCFKNKLIAFIFLDHPASLKSKIFHASIFCLTLIAFIFSMITIVPSIDNQQIEIVNIIIQIILILEYTLEFILRVWSCDIFEKYRGFRRLMYVFSPYMIIDIIVLFTTIPLIIFYFDDFGTDIDVSVFLKFMQILRFFRFERYHGSVRMMTKVLYVHRNELLTGYCSALMLIFFTTFIIYLVERNKGNIKTVTDSFYFIVISFLTIGYGDIVPTGLASRFIIIITALLGVALAAVPSGIIGSGFALQVASRNKRRKKREVQKPSIILLQRVFKAYLYVIKDNSRTEKIDIEVAKNHAKFYSVFCRKDFVFTSQNQEFQASPFQILDDTLNQDPQKTITTVNYSPNSNSKMPLHSIFSRFKANRKTSPQLNNADSKKPIIKISAKFCRILFMNAAVIRFKKFRTMASMEETIENIENNQKKMNCHIEEIQSNIRYLKQKQKSQMSVHSSPCQECHRVKEQMNEIKDKMESLEDTIKSLVSLINKNTTV